MILRRWSELRRRSLVVGVWLTELELVHLRRLVEIDGLEHLDAALARGAGAIIASPHFGYPRLIKPLLLLHGQRAHLVGHSAHPWPERIGEDLPTGLNLRPLLAALRRNDSVIILIDGRTAESAHRADVLGIEVPFATGVMSIARSTGASVVPAFLVDESSLRKPVSLRLVIHPALEIQRTGEPALDLQENTRRFARVYENEIRVHPQNLPWGRVRQGVMHAFGAQMNGEGSASEYVERVRELVAGATPFGAVVLLVTNGDDALLEVPDRVVWHFPRCEDGRYGGGNPVDGEAALASVEVLRDRGATDIVFPEPELWWLDFYGELRAYLESDGGGMTRGGYGVAYSLPVTAR